MLDGRKRRLLSENMKRVLRQWPNSYKAWYTCSEILAYVNAQIVSTKMTPPGLGGILRSLHLREYLDREYRKDVRKSNNQITYCYPVYRLIKRT